MINIKGFFEYIANREKVNIDYEKFHIKFMILIFMIDIINCIII